MDQTVLFARLLCAIQGMQLHLKTGGKMRLTRMATPATLRKIASEFTGKEYPRSKHGMETALADLEAIKEKCLATTKPSGV